MKNLLVVGDSFCAGRETKTDWPVILAKHLDLNLVGFGLAGESWWAIRKKFIELLLTDDFINSELVVFCHTEPHRIIGSDGTIIPQSTNETVIKTYLLHLQNYEFNDWACEHWFKELNTILTNKKVIHIQNFPNTNGYFKYLNGIKLSQPSLAELSAQELGYATTDCLIYDRRRNHFNENNNMKLAYFLSKIYLAYCNHWVNTEVKVTLDDF